MSPRRSTRVSTGTRSWVEDRAAAIPSRARRDMIVRDQPARLSRETIVVLFVEGVGDQARARLDRFAVFKTLRNAAPEREGLGYGVARRWESRVTRRRKRGDVGRIQIVERFAERVRADVAIGCVRADIAKISVA